MRNVHVITCEILITVFYSHGRIQEVRLFKIKPLLAFLTEGPTVSWWACAPRGVGSCAMASVTAVEIFAS